MNIGKFMTIFTSTILLTTLMLASISTVPGAIIAQTNNTASTNNTNASTQALPTINVTSTNSSNIANQNTRTRDNRYGGDG